MIAGNETKTTAWAMWKSSQLSALTQSRIDSAILKLFGSCCRGSGPHSQTSLARSFSFLSNATLYFVEESNPLLDRYLLKSPPKRNCSILKCPIFIFGFDEIYRNKWQPWIDMLPSSRCTHVATSVSTASHRRLSASF